MQSANGTVCLGKDMSKTSVVQECRAWIARNPNGGEGSFGGRGLDATGKHTGSMTHPDDDYLLGWLESMGVAGQGFSFAKSGVPQPRMGRRLNLTLCDELEAALTNTARLIWNPSEASLKISKRTAETGPSLSGYAQVIKLPIVVLGCTIPLYSLQPLSFYTIVTLSKCD